MADNLDAIPGYTELNNQLSAALAKEALLNEQKLAARENGDIAAARQYAEQLAGLKDQQDQLATQIDRLVSGAPSPGPNPVTTTGQSQATPANNARDDGPTQAPTQGGTGAGTSSNASETRGSDNNPVPNIVATQQAISVFSGSANQLIATQPNQLDQYASYTYGISWYVLSPAQFKDMAATQRANVTGWQLLMQSAGAPAKGRSPAFPIDYYMDDLEISSKIWGGGKNAANNAVDIKFKVVEPNGISLIQSLFNAVKSVYAAAPTTNKTGGAPNYLTAQYCLVIQFYGYDVNGNLVSPAKGSFNTSGGYGQTAVITKYYPFTLTDIKFSVANRAVEYSIFGKPIPMKYNSSSDRGTIPTNFTMTGATVDQLLNGKPITVKNTADPGTRTTTPVPPYVSTLPMKEQAAIAAGTDPNAVNDQGMAFGGGGLTGA